MNNLESRCLGLLDGCLYRRVIVRVIYLAVAVLYCLSLFDCLLITCAHLELNRNTSKSFSDQSIF
jgi:hypothetical protein